MKISRACGFVLTCILTLVLLHSAIGCNVDPVFSRSRRPKGPAISITEAANGKDASVAAEAESHQTEVDWVESVATHRAAYIRALESLRDFYRDQGYLTKQSWADFELAGLARVQTFQYVMDAEVSSGQLHPTDSISEADDLYERGLNLMQKGGHGVPVFFRESPMVEAVGVLRKLIEEYPTSDKIDDAAFQLGQIHKEYLHDQEAIAVEWYERSWTWDPSTPHEPRFQAAVIYDYRLHDRDRALELYRRVLTEETPDQPCWSKLARRTNVDFATRRIAELTGDTRTARVGN